MKESKVDMLTTTYENTTTKQGEIIHEMSTIFASIMNELRSSGELVHPSKQVRKIIRVFPNTWSN